MRFQVNDAIKNLRPTTNDEDKELYPTLWTPEAQDKANDELLADPMCDDSDCLVAAVDINSHTESLVSKDKRKVSPKTFLVRHI